LAGEFAYKIKRPVHFPFVDQRSLERRRFLCLEELRLNRRFAPALYLDVVEVRLANGLAHIGGDGTVIEYAVRMRRFDQEQQLDCLLRRRGIAPPELEAFGRKLAVLHSKLAFATQADDFASAAQVREIALRNWHETAVASEALVGSSPNIAALRPALERQLDVAERWLTKRLADGFVRECHGDLHARNLARVQGELLAFDCVEFEPRFRWIDVADEAALLLTDLQARGCMRHAHAFLQAGWRSRGTTAACAYSTSTGRTVRWCEQKWRRSLSRRSKSQLGEHRCGSSIAA